MANKHTHFFQNLKHYSISPPKWLFKRIWIAIKKNDSVSNSSSLTKEDDMVENSDEYSQNEINIFRSLQEYSITPPSFALLNINKEQDKEAKIFPANKNIFSTRYITRIAAAVAILICSAWGGYYFIQSKKETDVAAAQIDSSKNNGGDFAASIDVNHVVAQSKSPLKNIDGTVIKNKRDNNKKRSSAIANASSTKHNNNSIITLVDDDVLLTLVSYKYTDYMPLLKSMEKKKKIQLGQFSYINISDKMNAMLKDMYATKQNNKPTRKARRVKSQLKKWKKADEKHFDKNKNNNPVDIIDLSEFILK